MDYPNVIRTEHKAHLYEVLARIMSVYGNDVYFCKKKIGPFIIPTNYLAGHAA